MESFYAIAENRSNATGIVNAECKLNTPLDLTKRSADVTVEQVFVRPSFEVLTGLSMSVESGTETGEIYFEDVYNVTEANIERILINQTAEKFGTRDALAKFVKLTDGLKLKLRKNSIAALSPKLARLLSLNTVLQNESKTAQATFIVNLNIPRKNALHSCVYLLKCSEVMPNTVWNNKVESLAAVLNLQGGETVVEYNPTKVTASRLRPGRYSSLSFTLYNLDNIPVQSFNTISILVLLKLQVYDEGNK